MVMAPGFRRRHIRKHYKKFHSTGVGSSRRSCCVERQFQFIEWNLYLSYISKIDLDRDMFSSSYFSGSWITFNKLIGGGDVQFLYLRVVPFSDDRRRYEHPGRNFDFMVWPHDNPAIEDSCRSTPVGRYRFALLMACGHPLAKRRSLKFRDLSGETVMIMKPGTSPINGSMLAAVPLKEDLSIEYGVIACRTGIWSGF